MKNTAMRALNFAVKIKNNYKQLYAHDNETSVKFHNSNYYFEQDELSAIVVFVLPHFQLFLYFRWLT
ncbi:hypothetical protein F2X81_06730 [Staphylococcus aureus]|nr:hypothetical protein UC16_06785 [Staphylococcus aureus]ATZ14155.1 hypothetical protein CU118_04125 [Staphylococcus aureus]MCO4458926.1 hypothetical protein [Staphylococcus aureus]MSN55767.1 hypothetical protein [Staphylococcus aureus]MSN63133.1 hypothetical protein [Staphylococcus aureus]